MAISLRLVYKYQLPQSLERGKGQEKRKEERRKYLILYVPAHTTERTDQRHSVSLTLSCFFPLSIKSNSKNELECSLF